MFPFDHHFFLDGLELYPDLTNSHWNTLLVDAP